jgi:hypothetical protein
MALDDESIEEQIRDTINRLTSVFLGDLEHRYSLPKNKDGALPSSFQVLLPELQTELYRLSAKGDYHQVCIELELNLDAIEEIVQSLVTKRTPDPTWAFFGFIKELPSMLPNIKSFNDIDGLRYVADIATQTSNPFFTPFLKECVPHSALFLIAFDTDTVFEIKADKLATLRLPAAPRIDDITKLKTELKELLSIKFKNRSTSTDSSSSAQSNSPSFESEYSDFQYEAEKIAKSTAPAETKAIAMELLNVRLNENLARLYE